jgi:predicted nucleic acid-binding Zn ribbon protein
MWGVDTARAVVATLLPLALLGLLLALTLRWRKKQGETPTPPSAKPSRARAVIFTLVVLVVTGALSGWMGDGAWSRC